MSSEFTSSSRAPSTSTRPSTSTSSRTGAVPRCPFAAMFGARPAAVAVPSLADELKERTKDAHHRAEFHPLQQRIVRGQVSPSEYEPFARALHSIHRVLEAALDRSMTAEPRLGRVFLDRHRRSAHFAADFDSMQVSGEPSSLDAFDALDRMVEQIQSTSEHCPIALLGTLYVLEGSTNGGMVIARVLRRAWGLSEGTLRSIDPHAAETRASWGEFRAALDGVAPTLTARDRAKIVDGAMATFIAISSIMDECIERVVFGA